MDDMFMEDLPGMFFWISLLAVCITGSVAGWRKILPGLIIFALIDWAKHQRHFSILSKRIIDIVVMVAVYYLVKWLYFKLRAKYKKPLIVSHADNS